MIMSIIDFVLRVIHEPRLLAMILTGVGAGATVLTFAMPMLQGSGLDSRMKAVALERSKIRARERERVGKGETSRRQSPKTYMKQIVDSLDLGRWLGTSDARDVSSDNPLGLNPNDPNGKDDIVIQNDDLHLPVGKPVKVLLRSIDVLHDFYVPEFRAKMDMIPGSVTYYWFTPTRTGTFEVLCAELCGAAHAQMRSKVIVEEEKEYHAWLEKQRTFAEVSGQHNVAKAAYKTGSE